MTARPAGAAEITENENPDGFEALYEDISAVNNKKNALSEIPVERWEKFRKDLPSILASIGPVVPNQLSHLPATAAPELVIAHLHRDGSVIIDNAVSEETCDATMREMQPYIDDSKFQRSSFAGKVTKRIGALVARSPASWGIVAHPLLLEVCAGVLGRQLLYDLPEGAAEKGSDRFGNAPGYDGHPWQLHLTQIIDIGPNEPAQPLHRDRWISVSDHAFAGKIEPQISTMWALQDFTMEKGPTRVVPGSHRWSSDRTAKPAEAAHAVMSKGSVVIYTGSAWHSGGNNKSATPRTGLNVDYNLAWLAQEENQFLACPPHIAKDLPLKLQNLVGYVADPSGYFYDTGSPKRAFRGNEVNWASEWQAKGLTEAQSKL